MICSDKTGTLTLNRMTARRAWLLGRHFAVDGEGYDGRGRISAEDGADTPDLRPLLLPAALCTDSRIRDGELIGDPTEGALLVLAAKGGIDAESARGAVSAHRRDPLRLGAQVHGHLPPRRRRRAHVAEGRARRAARTRHPLDHPDGEQPLDEAARVAFADTTPPSPTTRCACWRWPGDDSRQ